MTELIQRLINEGQQVVSFPIREYWLDIGQPTDYEQAQKDIKQGKLLKRTGWVREFS
jgi:NDP-sugar pyrophosphorylase family protein